VHERRGAEVLERSRLGNNDFTRMGERDLLIPETERIGKASHLDKVP
jgi:hypothetical protein